MSRRQQSTRSCPADVWAMLGEHPSQRTNEMLAERLHLLAPMPQARRRPIRTLVIRLQGVWSRIVWRVETLVGHPVLVEVLEDRHAVRVRDITNCG